MQEGADVQITLDRLVEMAKSTWHVAVLLCGLIWAIASYKAGLDSHLNLIDNQLKAQDNKLSWLVNHHADRQALPNDPQYMPQSDKSSRPSLLQIPAVQAQVLEKAHNERLLR